MLLAYIHFICRVYLFLYLPFCMAGDMCPSRAELKTCTCHQLKLKSENTPLHQRVRRSDGQRTSISTTNKIDMKSTTIMEKNVTFDPVGMTDSTNNFNGHVKESQDNHTGLSDKRLSTETDIEISPSNVNGQISLVTNTSTILPIEDKSFAISTQQPDNPNNKNLSAPKPLNSQQHVTEVQTQGRKMEYSFTHIDEDGIVDPSGVGVLGRRTWYHGYGYRTTKKAVSQRDPHSNDRKPENLYLTVVDCKAPHTITEFEEILLFALHRRSVDKLIVSYLPPAKEETLARLPSKCMRNTRIKQFEISDTALSGDFIWFGSPFEGQANSLLRFAVNRCYLYGALTFDDPGTVHTKGLHQLPHVEVVDFSDNHLTIVRTTAFSRPPSNLTTVNLSRNSLQTVEPGCFANVTFLRFLDLSHNLLKRVNRTIFAASARFLEVLNLSENFLNFLPVDFFDGMPALKNVDLGRNFLHSMPEKPWSTVYRQLAHLDVTDNFLYCDCHFKWLLPLLPNATSAPEMIRGACTHIRMPLYAPVTHPLSTLTREVLMC